MANPSHVKTMQVLDVWLDGEYLDWLRLWVFGCLLWLVYNYLICASVSSPP